MSFVSESHKRKASFDEVIFENENKKIKIHTLDDKSLSEKSLLNEVNDCLELNDDTEDKIIFGCKVIDEIEIIEECEDSLYENPSRVGISTNENQTTDVKCPKELPNHFSCISNRENESSINNVSSKTEAKDLLNDIIKTQSYVNPFIFNCFAVGSKSSVPNVFNENPETTDYGENDSVQRISFHRESDISVNLSESADEESFTVENNVLIEETDNGVKSNFSQSTISNCMDNGMSLESKNEKDIEYDDAIIMDEVTEKSNKNDVQGNKLLLESMEVVNYENQEKLNSVISVVKKNSEIKLKNEKEPITHENSKNEKIRFKDDKTNNSDMKPVKTNSVKNVLDDRIEEHVLFNGDEPNLSSTISNCNENEISLDSENEKNGEFENVIIVDEVTEELFNGNKTNLSSTISNCWKNEMSSDIKNEKDIEFEDVIIVDEVIEKSFNGDKLNLSSTISNCKENGMFFDSKNKKDIEFENVITVDEVTEKSLNGDEPNLPSTISNYKENGMSFDSKTEKDIEFEDVITVNEVTEKSFNGDKPNLSSIISNCWENEMSLDIKNEKDIEFEDVIIVEEVIEKSFNGDKLNLSSTISNCKENGMSLDSKNEKDIEFEDVITVDEVTEKSFNGDKLNLPSTISNCRENGMFLDSKNEKDIEFKGVIILDEITEKSFNGDKLNLLSTISNCRDSGVSLDSKNEKDIEFEDVIIVDEISEKSYKNDVEGNKLELESMEVVNSEDENQEQITLVTSVIKKTNSETKLKSKKRLKTLENSKNKCKYNTTNNSSDIKPVKTNPENNILKDKIEEHQGSIENIAQVVTTSCKKIVNEEESGVNEITAVGDNEDIVNDMTLVTNNISVENSSEKINSVENCDLEKKSCFFCKDTVDNEMVRCSSESCDKIFHKCCLEKLPSVKSKVVACPHHLCISCYHSNPKNPHISKGNMFQCNKCPTAFHQKSECFIPGSKKIEKNIVSCPNHFFPENKRNIKAVVNLTFCYSCGGNVGLIFCKSCPFAIHKKCLKSGTKIKNEYICARCSLHEKFHYDDIVWAKIYDFRWWPAKIINPDELPKEIFKMQHFDGEFPIKFFGTEQYFWVNTGRIYPFLFIKAGLEDVEYNFKKVFQDSYFEEAVELAVTAVEEKKVLKKSSEPIDTKKPPSYKHIKSNRPIGNVQIYTCLDDSDSNICGCEETDKNPCGYDTICLNRNMLQECHDGICQLGDKCENRKFVNVQNAACKPFYTEDKGWGLKAIEDIKKGHFVIEYVGDLIDEEECERRIKHKQAIGDTNFYFCTLDSSRIIDAGPKGNYSRFMNHSCDPNCETQKWIIQGDPRVGIFARKDIKAGAELTFDYQMDFSHYEKLKCNCGSERCSGLIGKKPQKGNRSSKVIEDNSIEESSKDDSISKKLVAKKKRTESVNSKKEEIKKKGLDKQNGISKVNGVRASCFKCKAGGRLIECSRKSCNKSFHLRCLKNGKNTVLEGWECPSHFCKKCAKESKYQCQECPTAFCLEHVVTKPKSKIKFLCSKHC